MIRVITDSAADFQRPYPDNLTVLPMTISFGSRSYRDGVDLSHRAFYQLLLENKELPKTSQINPDRFQKAFRAALGAGESVVAIIMSSKLSGTYQSACIAAEEFPGQVYVVDSENAAIGEAILVHRALELAGKEADAAAIAAQLDIEKKQIRLAALLDTLEFLRRGGRLSQPAAVVGSLLSIKPVVSVVDGQVVVLGKARGSRNGYLLLDQQIEKFGGIDYSRPFALAYSGFDPENLERYLAFSRVNWKRQKAPLPIYPIGATIGTHVGPGGVAFAYFRK